MNNWRRVAQIEYRDPGYLVIAEVALPVSNLLTLALVAVKLEGFVSVSWDVALLPAWVGWNAYFIATVLAVGGVFVRALWVWMGWKVRGRGR